MTGLRLNIMADHLFLLVVLCFSSLLGIDAFLPCAKISRSMPQRDVKWTSGRAHPVGRWKQALAAANNFSGDDFNNEAELEEWLTTRRVPRSMAKVAAPILFQAGFSSPISLLGITTDEFLKMKLTPPIARTLANTLTHTPHSSRFGRSTFNFDKVTIDVSGLFTTNPDDGSYRLNCDATTNVLDISVLDDLTTTSQGERPFLPPQSKLYVRPCMNEIFHHIVNKPDDKTDTIIGSPGVGTSILSFIAALCYASLDDAKQVLYLRRASESSYHTSVFWIRQAIEDGHIDVYQYCDRDDYSSRGLAGIVSRFQADYVGEAGSLVFSHNFRAFCDGPRSRQVADRCGAGFDLIATGGYEYPREEATEDFRTLPLSAWTQQEVIDGLEQLYGMDKNTARTIYDTMGGKIRTILGTIEADQTGAYQLKPELLIEGQETLDYFMTDIFTEEDAEAAYCSRSRRITGLGMDFVRMLYATELQPGSAHYKTVQFAASPYVLRAIRSRLPLSTVLWGVDNAKDSNVDGLYDLHFELLGHKLFQVASEQQAAVTTGSKFTPDGYDFGVVQGTGKGVESVKQLQGRLYWSPINSRIESTYEAAAMVAGVVPLQPDMYDFKVIQGTGPGTGKAEESVVELAGEGLYWTPSTSTFNNIDAAILLGGVLYCLQYTISEEHQFNCVTFFSEFYEKLPPNVQEKVNRVEVVFVIPEDITFKEVQIPSYQNKLLEEHAPVLIAQDIIIACTGGEATDEQKAELDRINAAPNFPKPIVLRSEKLSVKNRPPLSFLKRPEAAVAAGADVAT